MIRFLAPIIALALLLSGCQCITTQAQSDGGNSLQAAEYALIALREQIGPQPAPVAGATPTAAQQQLLELQAIEAQLVAQAALIGATLSTTDPALPAPAAPATAAP